MILEDGLSGQDDQINCLVILIIFVTKGVAGVTPGAFSAYRAFSALLFEK
jgi:hypothetical protein